MSELRQEFEKSFPIPAHWIEWSESKNRYDCHVGLADSKCAEYNKMFNVWCVRQAKIDELQLKNAELARIMLDKNRDIVNQAMQIDDLKTQLNNMEQCYIQAKKERDELLSRVTKAQGCFQDFYSTGYHVHIFEADEALRGDYV